MKNELQSAETPLLDIKAMKDLVKEDTGELIRLVDIESTKGTLIDIAKRYENLVVTEENYKGEVKEAEKYLRNIRYCLQNIHKKNNSYLNTTKTTQNELFDTLIQITRVQEDRLKSEMDEIKNKAKREKEEAERKAKELLESINNRLSDYDKRFMDLLLKVNTDEGLKEYDDLIEELTDCLEEFGEFQFKAKRMISTYKGRRKEVVERVDYEKEKKETEAKRQKNAEKILSYRNKKLVELGYSLEGDTYEYLYERFDKNKISLQPITVSELKEMDEIDFMECIDSFEKIKNREVKLYGEMSTESKEKSLADWKEVCQAFKKAGLSTKDLDEKVLPSLEKLTKAKETLKNHNEAQKKKRNDEILSEIKPFRDSILGSYQLVQNKIKGTEFKHTQSEELLKNFLKESEKLVETFLGLENQ